MADAATDPISRLSLTVVCEADEQGQMLCRELQRTRAQVRRVWPVPEQVGDNTDILICEFIPDLSRRYAWMPGEARAATVILLPQSGRYDMAALKAAVPDAVLHRPYQQAAIRAALMIAWDHFSYSRRQRVRIARMDENLRSLRDIERAKNVLMAEQQLDEQRAFNVLRSMAMERRLTVAAMAATLIDSHHGDS